jgi:MoxR-like ATPase
MDASRETGAFATTDDATWANEAIRRVRSEVHRVIVGQDRVLDEILLAMLCGAHAVVEGVPGLAKTLLIATLARTLGMQFSRIQFTPDLMPSDITGTEVIQEDRTTGNRSLRFVRGPIFANLVLADEINRTPPKTQAALLEAMQERQVTVGGVAHHLPSPFFVLATQNPIEQEGTYPLPEAQLDRFMLNIRIGYPTEAEEMEIVARTTGEQVLRTESVLSAEDLARAQSVVRRMPIAEHVMRHALRIVRATRVKQEPAATPQTPAIVRDYVAWGAGPRASQFLVLAAKAKALLSGDSHVETRHLHAVSLPVLRHRIVTNFNAEADGVTSETIIQRLIDEVPVDAAADGQPLDRLIR